jgi:hypothetical protein
MVAAVLLDVAKLLGKLLFLQDGDREANHMATLPQFVPAEVVHDFDFPQREAAFFFGLFLRGHSAEQLRRDIEVPSAVLAKWHREADHDPQLRDIFTRIVEYRRHVLAIFDTLVGSDGQNQLLQ